MLNKYLFGAFVLVFAYLVLRNPSGTNSILSALSNTNTNAILALQGRQPAFG